MAADPGTRADAARNRERIREAALVVVSRGEVPTVGSVAREAGLTRATLYRHFRDRDDLLRSVFADFAREQAAAMVAAVHGLPLEEAMRSLADGVVRAVSEHPRLLAVLDHDVHLVAREAVPDDPMAAELARRRATGELSGPLPDDWLAAAIRALCLAAIQQLEPISVPGAQPDDVAGWLGQSLVRLLR